MPDFSGARILISNDDGINAPGIKVLEELARTLSDDVWVCAPESEQSASSHSLTLTRPVRIRERGERKFSVDGTPTDCVLIAINHLLRDKKPDLMLSGINHGQNLSDDITYSGTIAAAMEATVLGVPAIAFSHSVKVWGDAPKCDWDVPRKYFNEIVNKVAKAAWPPNVLVNVNFPDVPAEEVTGIEIARQGKHKIGDHLDARHDPRGRAYFWIGEVRQDADIAEDTDIAVINRGGISITPLSLDLTHQPMLDDLRRAFA
jgi:5'-nucleotidase